jgi:hypothetical protein
MEPSKLTLWAPIAAACSLWRSLYRQVGRRPFSDRHLNLQLVDFLKLLSCVCPGKHSAGAFLPCKRIAFRIGILILVLLSRVDGLGQIVENATADW